MSEAKTVPRRERILSAAVSEFTRNGFAGARVERIATSAGVNKQLLFHYFGSKEGLHRAALASVLEGFDPAGQPGSPPASRLNDLISRLVATVEAHPALVAMLASSQAAADASQLVEDWRAAVLGQARRILEDGQRAGFLRDDLDVDSMAEVIVGSALGRRAAGRRGDADGTDGYQETLLKMLVEYSSWR
jgi:TetR/AcrR family transcriptional regulator